MPDTNWTVVMKCLEQTLKSITAANGYATDGMLVDRAKDPRISRQNLPAQYAQYHAAAVVVPEKRLPDPKLVMNGKVRIHAFYHILGLRTLTSEEDGDNEVLDDLVSQMQDDIYDAMRKDELMQRAASALRIDPPHILNHRWEQTLAGDPSWFPDAHFVMTWSFRYDRAVPVG